MYLLSLGNPVYKSSKLVKPKIAKLSCRTFFIKRRINTVEATLRKLIQNKNFFLNVFWDLIEGRIHKQSAYYYHVTQKAFLILKWI